MLIDDGSSAVSLPEVALLGVLPGTGGLTRLTDKRLVRHDIADHFCTLEEGVRGKRAVQWRLVDEVVPSSRFTQTVQQRARQMASEAHTDTGGILLAPLERVHDGTTVQYPHVQATLDRSTGTVDILIEGPDNPPPANIDGAVQQACDFWPLALVRELDDLFVRQRAEVHLGADAAPLMVLYHSNPGWPLLDAGARLLVKSRKTIEWTKDETVTTDVYTKVAGPRKRMHDDVYVHRPRADRRGDVRVGLVNDRLGLGLYWKFPRKELPLLNQWQHFHRGTYVSGIEPGNCSALGRAWNRKHGTLEYLAPGESREFHLEMGVLDGEKEIDAFERSMG